MVTLRNVWTDILSHFKPDGHPDSVIVKPGQTVEVPGELAAEQPHDDAIVIDQPSGEKLAYPKALWEHVGEEKPNDAPSAPGASGPGSDTAGVGAVPAPAPEVVSPVAPAPVFGTAPESASAPAPAAPSEG